MNHVRAPIGLALSLSVFGFGCFTEVCRDGSMPAGEGCDDGSNPVGQTSDRMSFFVTSRGVEVNGVTVAGGNFGGLDGADAFCRTLAQEVREGDQRSWVAFLSTKGGDARDRIGTGPWYNAGDQMIAPDLETLFSSPPPTAMILDESGRAWNGGVSARHDVVTGSNHDGRNFDSLDDMMMSHPNPDGSLFSFPDGSFVYGSPAFDFSCADWTTNEGGLMSANYMVVGHLDWSGLAAGTGGNEWLTSHTTACDQEEINASGGDMRIYCFSPD
jgi:hypothetical protein